jgi:hypothetical protein
MDSREKRLAENEALFRDVNERVRALAASHGRDAHAYEFFCECSNINCSFQLEATLAEYEAVRAHGDRFLIKPEHFLPEIERIVEKNERWWVVMKEGAAGELVEELNPRDD